jgi:predicted amidohydrolase YtcJ
MMYAYTRNSAAALGQLSEIGTIAPGKRADLVLVDRDVLTVPTGELAKASIVFTMFDGKVVYGTSP